MKRSEPSGPKDSASVPAPARALSRSPPPRSKRSGFGTHLAEPESSETKQPSARPQLFSDEEARALRELAARAQREEILHPDRLEEITKRLDETTERIDDLTAKVSGLYDDTEAVLEIADTLSAAQLPQTANVISEMAIAAVVDTLKEHVFAEPVPLTAEQKIVAYHIQIGIHNLFTAMIKSTTGQTTISEDHQPVLDAAIDAFKTLFTDNLRKRITVPTTEERALELLDIYFKPEQMPAVLLACERILRIDPEPHGSGQVYVFSNALAILREKGDARSVAFMESIYQRTDPNDQMYPIYDIAISEATNRLLSSDRDGFMSGLEAIIMNWDYPGGVPLAIAATIVLIWRKEEYCDYQQRKDSLSRLVAVADNLSEEDPQQAQLKRKIERLRKAIGEIEASPSSAGESSEP